MISPVRRIGIDIVRGIEPGHRLVGAVGEAIKLLGGIARVYQLQVSAIVVERLGIEEAH
ncbi:hypothetical protein D3C80_1946980 [compost metagenome]